MMLKQVFIINNDLKMGKGKIAVQTAHGETLYMDKIRIVHQQNLYNELVDKRKQMLDDYTEWKKDKLMKKVVLKATQEEMLLLIGTIKLFNECMSKNSIWFDIVFDKGLTQVPANSMTCIVFEPLDEQMADHYFKHLKLL